MVVVARDWIEPPASADAIGADKILLDFGELELAFPPQRRSYFEGVVELIGAEGCAISGVTNEPSASLN
jgi:hypothetical protein